MIEAQLNYFDMAVIGIISLSCIFAFFRGFVKEILSLVAWVGAATITVAFFKPVSEMLAPHFAKPMTAAICTTLVLYVGSLIGFAIINRFIIKILKSGSEMGWIDNLLGLAFGALRGSFIVSLAFLMMSLAVQGTLPEWLQKAKTRPYVEKGAMMLVKIAPQYLDKISNLQKNAKDNVQGSATENFERSVHDRTVGIAPTGGSITEKDATKSFEQILKNSVK